MFQNFVHIITILIAYLKNNPGLTFKLILIVGFFYFMASAKEAYHEPGKFFRRLALLISGLFIAYYIYIQKDVLPELLSDIVFAYALICVGTNAKKKSGANKSSSKTIVNLGGISWSLKEFCRGWVVTGETGSGKTAGFYMNLLHQLFSNVPKWGGLTVDAKGSFYRDVVGVAKNYQRAEKVIVVGPDRKSKHKFNLLSYDKIPRSRYADIIVNVAAPGTAEGGSGSGGHFKVRIKNALIHAMNLLDMVYEFNGNKEELTIPKLRDFLTISAVKELLAEIPEHMRNTEAVKYFQDDFLYHVGKGGDEFQSFLTTLSNYLSPYLNPDIAEVFSSDKSTFDLSDMDKGKIICVSIPPVYSERDHINTFMKELYYYHAQLREELSKQELKRKNLLVLIADEAQSIVTRSEGMDDTKVIDKIRSTQATVVFASQSSTSFLDKLGQYKTEILLLNLANKVYFRQPDERGAKLAESDLGKDEKFEKQSYGYSNSKSSVTYQKKETGEHRYYNLRKLPDFVCIAKHAKEHITKEIKLNPLNYRGKILNPE